MLPPPTTTAVWTPRSTISASCRATRLVASVLMPDWESAGANASPESFNRTRLYVGRDVASASLGSHRLAGRSPRRRYSASSPSLYRDEALDGNLLADLGGDLVEQLLHRLRVVLHERLVEQHDVLEVRGQLALDDLLDHVLGLAGLLGLRLGRSCARRRARPAGPRRGSRTAARPDWRCAGRGPSRAPGTRRCWRRSPSRS